MYQQLRLWERTCGVSRETGQEGSEPWPGRFRAACREVGLSPFCVLGSRASQPGRA